jgi:nicotinamide riboside kinase
MGKYIICGVDRLGKSSLVQGLQDKLGYHLVLHYEKPKLLDVYADIYDENKHALRQYQEQSFINMFKVLGTNANIICDRAHLGEFVYAPYRGYDGSYVFKMEKEHDFDGPGFTSTTKLILLTTSNWDIINDDGNSIDFSRRQEEQELFKNAVGKSIIRNKVIIDVHNGKGGFKTLAEILDLAIYG